MFIRKPQSLNRRAGVMLPLAAVCLTIVIVVAAFTIDLGFISLTRSQAQNCADAAALAAAGELYPDMHPQTAIKLPISLPIYEPARPYPNTIPAIAATKTVCGANRCGDLPALNVLEKDVRFGIYEQGTVIEPTPLLPLVDGLLSLLNLRTANHTFVNSCQVTVRRDAQANQPVKLFFAPLLGRSTQSLDCSATAAIERGYGLSAGDKLLPFAMDITIWNALRFTNGELNAVTLKPLGIDLQSITLSGLLGSSGLLSLLNSNLPLAMLGSPVNILDGYTYQRGMKTVAAGPDGINEVVLLGDQLHTTLLGGLLGQLLPVVQRIPSLMVTIETGPPGRSTPDVARLRNAIRNGLTSSDILNMTGSSSGEMWLPFTTRAYFEIPDGCEADLIAIIGQPRIMPLYATLPGTVNKVTDILGMSHSIKMVGWAGVVVTEVNLHGPVRYFNVQPAVYARHTVLPARGARINLPGSYMSDGVFTTPRLVK